MKDESKATESKATAAVANRLVEGTLEAQSPVTTALAARAAAKRGVPAMFGSTPAPAPQGYQRHALGLPAGSVRAILALGILGLLWLFVYRYDDDHRLPLEFIYLQILMLLMLASYFTAHGKTVGRQVSPRSPLGLPSGV